MTRDEVVNALITLSDALPYPSVQRGEHKHLIAALGDHDRQQRSEIEAAQAAVADLLTDRMVYEVFWIDPREAHSRLKFIARFFTIEDARILAHSRIGGLFQIHHNGLCVEACPS